METFYKPNKELYFPTAYFSIEVEKTKKQWLKLMPVQSHIKFNEWFTKS